jgi:regulator of sigma E protease
MAHRSSKGRALAKASRSIGKIGAFGADVTSREPMTFGRSITAGAQQTWTTATKIVEVVYGLLTGGVSPRQLGGPIAITRASVSAAQSGLESLFMLIALLSVNVAVLNLLPIPILDGGQILLNIAEAVKGSPFSSRTREYILRFGLVAILLIFALSTFNDVRDGLSRLFG